MLSTLNTATKTHQLKLNILSKNCLDIINQLPASVKLISFDCFDTLLWRHVAEPKDVFYDLCEDEKMKQHGLTVGLRMNSEQAAYHLNKIKKNKTQANLEEIYQQAFPKLTLNDIQELVQIELNYEKQACFAFQPMVELVHILHERGYEIIITSDIYFTEKNLRSLLEATLSPHTLNCFKAIYTSCDEGTAKFENLFPTILKKHHLKPHEVCHMGDHLISDFEKPLQHGLHAIHLTQYLPAVEEIFRMQAVSSPFVDASIRQSRPLKQYFKQEISTAFDEEIPADLIGYAVMGPLMMMFAEYIIQTVNTLKKSRKHHVKVAYLLRDAYLPARVTHQLYGEALGKEVRISRYAAFAASFRTTEDIDQYLAERIESKRFNEMGKQLGLPDNLVEKIANNALTSKNPIQTFNQFIHQKDIQTKIFEASKKYRNRLYLYLKNTLNLQPGDTLVFVDLGYTGTAQLRLAPLFKEEYQIDIQGCYLLSLKTPVAAIEKSGLISHEHFNDQTLKMLVTYIALIEQICTSPEPSVVDFDDQGQPIMDASKLSEKQIQCIRPIHEACFRFIQHHCHKADYHWSKRSENERRDIAGTTLARLLFLPTQHENAYFSEFQHDVNLGTEDTIKLINIEKSLSDLNERGWLHSLNVSTKESRMNYPAEWRSLGIELSITLMAQHQFDFKLTANDLNHRTFRIPVVIHHQNQNETYELNAYHTHDGFYSLVIPITSHDHIAIALGSLFSIIQIPHIDMIPMDVLYKKNEAQYKVSAFNHISLHEMSLISDEIAAANSQDGLLIFKNQASVRSMQVLRVIFRPLANQNLNA